jgi:hypothetical protein
MEHKGRACPSVGQFMAGRKASCWFRSAISPAMRRLQPYDDVRGPSALSATNALVERSFDRGCDASHGALRAPFFDGLLGDAAGQDGSSGPNKRSSSRRNSRRARERTLAKPYPSRLSVRRERAAGRGSLHSSAAAAQVNPAPKPTITTRSLGRSRPLAAASASAIGIDAALVLP